MRRLATKIVSLPAVFATRALAQEQVRADQTVATAVGGIIGILVLIVIGAVVGWLALAGLSATASAQPIDVMLNDCSNVGQSFFRDFEARTDMRYNGQRADGTFAVGGRIFLETRHADFTCSFDGSGRRMTQFFAEGRAQPGYLPGAAAPPSGTGLAQVANVPANDVLNVRGGPGTGYRINGALTNGSTVRLLQCSEASGSQWCEVEMMTDMRERGWVNARYLSRGAAIQQPGPPPTSIGGTTTVRVHFPAGTTRTQLSDTLATGATRRYLLGARDRQFLAFGLSSSDGGTLRWRIFNPDESLLDEAATERGYRGELWQTGDHVVEVTNLGNRTGTFTATFSIR